MIIDFKDERDELNLQKKEYEKLVKLNDERVRLTRVNQLDYKLTSTLFFAMLPYFGLVLSVMGLSSLIGVSTLASIIPPLAIPTILFGCSLGIGAVISKRLDKKHKIKERIEAFSKAKTEEEKFEEEINYQIELEKANNRSQIVQWVNSFIHSNENLMCNSSINETNKTEEVVKKRIAELTTTLEEKYRELDILITQKVLSENFWRLRSKGQKGMDIIVAFMGGGMMLFTLHSIPLFLMQDALTFTSAFASIVATLLPFSIGAVGVGSYWLNRNKNREKAFNNINDKLGEDSLPKKVLNVSSEAQELKSLIDSKVSDIYITEIALKEQEKALEIIESQDSEANENKKELSNDIPLLTEELPTLGAGETVEDDHSQEKGPILARRRIPTNPDDKK